MAADRALASRLPEDCARSVLALLAVKDIPAAAACSRAWSAAARTSQLWMALVNARWPATASGTLRQAVLRRGPREYYRQQAAVLRTHTPRRPPLDLNDLLVQLDLTQNGRTICSVAREARDVLRRDCEDIGSRPQDGIIFDGLHARVDTSKDNLFPPEEDPVSISCSVIRKSDGRVAALAPTAELEMKSGWELGRQDRSGAFAANPLLRGYLPAVYMQPTLLGGDPQDVSTSWLLGRTNGNYMCRTVAVVHFGTRREFPYNSGPWVPSPDPSVVAGEGYVELRRILVAFAFHLEGRLEDHERYDEFDDGRRVIDSHDLNLDELRLAFDQRLVFR